jgi:hypothetical protein
VKNPSPQIRILVTLTLGRHFYDMMSQTELRTLK